MTPNLTNDDSVIDQQPLANNEDGFSASIESADSSQNRTLLQIAWERKLLLLLGAVVGTVLSYFWYKHQTPTYQASSRLLILRKGADPLSMTGDTRSFDFRMSYFEDYVANQQLIVRSPVLLSRVVERPEIQALSWFKDENQAMNKLLNILNVTRADKTENQNVLKFSYSSSDAQECGTVLQVLIDSYRKYLDDTFKDNSKLALDLMRQLTDNLEKQIAENQRAIIKFSEDAPWELQRASTKDGVGINTAALFGWQNEVDVLGARQKKIEAHLKYLENARRAGQMSHADLVQVARRFERSLESTPTATTTRASIDELLGSLRLKESQLLQTYGADHLSVRKVRHEMDWIRKEEERRRKEINTTLAPQDDPLIAHIRMLQEEEKSIEASLAIFNEAVENEKKKSKGLLKYYDIKMDLERTKNRLESTREAALKKLQDLSLTKDAGGYRVEVIQPPPMRGVRIAPNRDSYLGGGLALGLLAGFGLVYLAEVTNKSFRTPAEISRRLGMSVIGHVPAIGLSKSEAVAGESNRLDPQLVAQIMPKSKQAEAFRQIRTALYFNSRAFHCRTIQVTSPRAGDGKTTVSSNMSISIAQSGKRILLVDADCRRPRVHKLFGQENDVGLTTILSKGVPWTEVVKETGVEGLHLMVAGPNVPNPAELLTGDSFAKLLQTLAQEYDFVVVDTPPLLAVTDPSVVAVRVDGVVLVVRIGHAERLDAERASHILRSLKTRSLGVIVNGCEPNAGYQYQYGYDYYYRYYGNYRNRYYSYDGGYYGNDESTDSDKESEESAQDEPLPKK